MSATAPHWVCTVNMLCRNTPRSRLRLAKLSLLALMCTPFVSQAQPAVMGQVQGAVQAGAQLSPHGQLQSVADATQRELSGLDDRGLGALVRQGLLPLESALKQLPAADQLWLNMPLLDDEASRQQIAQEARLLIAQLRHWQSGTGVDEASLVSGEGTERARAASAMDPVESLARQCRLIASRLFSAVHGGHERLPRGIQSLLDYTSQRIEQFTADHALETGPVMALVSSMQEQIASLGEVNPADWARIASSVHQRSLQLENVAALQDSRSMQLALRHLRSKLPSTETGLSWRYELDRALSMLDEQGWVDLPTMNALLADWELLAEAH